VFTRKSDMMARILGDRGRIRGASQREEKKTTHLTSFSQESQTVRELVVITRAGKGGRGGENIIRGKNVKGEDVHVDGALRGHRTQR